VLDHKHTGLKQIDIALRTTELFDVAFKGDHPFVGDATDFKKAI
jgi:hypothetical protein